LRTQEFGRSAIQLLEGELNVERVLGSLGGPGAAEGRAAAAAQLPPGQAGAASLETCFARCGGRQVSEVRCTRLLRLPCLLHVTQ
jgi:hypothetical protein